MTDPRDFDRRMDMGGMDRPLEMENRMGSPTPWGWIAFGILAAGVVIFAIVWLVRRKHDDGSPSAPATGA